MSKKLISQGAEAKIYLDADSDSKTITKHRFEKNYRIQEIDKKIRKSRTKSEKKILEKASKITPVPKVIETDKKEFDKISLEFIKGQRLSENLDLFNIKKQKQIINKIADSLARLHDNNIIHGDLTTSNMILSENDTGEKSIYLIDFGLSFISARFEDKAVDLHLFKQALEAKHYKEFSKLYEIFLEQYKKSSKNAEKTLERLRRVESRGRYKKK